MPTGTKSSVISIGGVSFQSNLSRTASGEISHEETIPAALARQFTHDLRKMMLLAVIFGELFTFGGLWLSYELDVASGATIILLSGTALFAYFGFSAIRSRWFKVRQVSSSETGDYYGS